MIQRQKGHWHYNASRVPGSVKKPVGFEEWFYTGPSWFFGHAKPTKKKGKKG
jgi:hypothetical protein